MSGHVAGTQTWRLQFNGWSKTGKSVETDSKQTTKKISPLKLVIEPYLLYLTVLLCSTPHVLQN